MVNDELMDSLGDLAFRAVHNAELLVFDAITCLCSIIDGFQPAEEYAERDNCDGLPFSVWDSILSTYSDLQKLQNLLCDANDTVGLASTLYSELHTLR